MATDGPLFTQDEVEYQMTHINENRGPEILASAIVLAVLAMVAVVLRLTCRRYTKCAISWDEYTILAGLLFSLSLCFCQGYSVHLGSGKHVLAVGLKDTQAYLKLLYAFQLFWAFAIVFIKISILLFYRRVFPPEATPQKWRICHSILLVLSVILFLISIFGSGFECTPVAFIWDFTIPGGHCINLIALSRFTSISNTITDILILSLPIPIILNLHMNRTKKIGVCGVFLLGGFVCIASIVRFIYLQQLNRMDPTFTNINAGIWTTVEPCIGIVSACLPIMTPILHTNFVAFVTSTFRSKKATYQGHSSDHPRATFQERKTSGKSVGTGLGTMGGMGSVSGMTLFGSGDGIDNVSGFGSGSGDENGEGMTRQGSGDEEMGFF